MTEYNERSSFRRHAEVRQSSWRGHRWTVSSYSEYGEAFYFDDDERRCPYCGAGHDEPPPGAPWRFLGGRSLTEAVALERTLALRGAKGFGRCLTYRSASCPQGENPQGCPSDSTRHAPVKLSG
jgi:hypothetical protein